MIYERKVVVMIADHISKTVFLNQKEIYFKSWFEEIRKIRRLYDSLPKDVKEKQEALTRWCYLCEEALSYCDTLHDVSVVYYSVPLDTPTQWKVFRLWSEKFDQKIESEKSHTLNH